MTPRLAGLLVVLVTARALAQAPDGGAPLPAEVSLWVGEERTYAAPPHAVSYSGASNVNVRPEAPGLLRLSGAGQGTSTLLARGGKKSWSTVVHVYSPWLLGHARPVPQADATLEMNMGEQVALRVGRPLALSTAGCRAVAAHELSFGVWVLTTERPGRCTVTLTGAGLSRSFVVEARAAQVDAKRVVMRTRQLRVGDVERLSGVGDLLPAGTTPGAVEARFLDGTLVVVGTRAGPTAVQLHLEDGKTLVYPFEVTP